MHKILLEDGAKPVRQPQRRLNPVILDVVKKEVTKFLQVGIIYPISYIQWVTPVKVVPLPKKTGSPWSRIYIYIYIYFSNITFLDPCFNIT
jgi:hypothetical protein